MADAERFDDHTVMRCDNKREMKEIVTTLIEKRKDFQVTWQDDFGWTVRVEEINEVGGLAGRWADV